MKPIRALLIANRSEMNIRTDAIYADEDKLASGTRVNAKDLLVLFA